MTAAAPRSSLHSATHSAMKRFRLPLASSLGGSSGLPLDKDANDDVLGVSKVVCIGIGRCTFMRSTPGDLPGMVAPAGDLDGCVLGHRPAVRDGGNRAHAPNIGESDDREIVRKRQEIA